MEKQIAWIDRNCKKYSMDEISDEYLLNILTFICDGGGYDHFLTKEKITNLFNEAEKRGLPHTNSLLEAIER